MPSKKPAAARKAAAKPVKSAAVKPPKSATARHVWTLPIAMLMLVVGASALWLAVHEASNAPEAATPSAAHAATAPEPAVSGSRKATTEAAAASVASDAPADPAAAHTTQSKAVTVTGCLQHAGDAFVLKNAEGAAVSKTRSWKSGFLKRTSPSIDLLDAGNGAHLGSHVGQRVSVSGPFAEGELRVQSLRRVAATCQ